MDCHTQRPLLFPRVDEARLNQLKLERTCQISQQITTDLQRNNTASLYHIERTKNLDASFSLPLNKPQRIPNPEKYRAVTENQLILD
jgi:hypothetical protein